MAIIPAVSIRPPIFPFEVELEIQAYTLVNYPVAPQRIAERLPAGLRPAVTELEGRPTAWFSVFLGRNVVRRIAGLPALPIEFNLVNYRTYVEGPEGRRLFIFHSLMGPQLLAMGVRMLPQLPADPEPFYFAPRIQDDRLLALEAEVGDGAEALRLQVEALDDEPWTPGFAWPQAAVEFLGNVPEALYPLPDGRLGQMFSPHPPLRPEAGRLLVGHFDWPQRHGILSAQAAGRPASVFLQASVPFPTRL
jgi:hypothetical protein